MSGQLNEVILTIGIPSYNRGHRACQVINELQASTLKTEIEFLVSNNGSIVNTEGYAEIAKSTDSRVSYIESKENLNFYGNIIRVCKNAKGKFVLLLSDEDSIDLDELENLICVLKSHPEVSCVRTADEFWYKNITQTAIFQDKKEAIDEFFLRNNYLSGVIYNKAFLDHELLEQIEKDFIDNYAYQVYPHMVIDMYMIMRGAFMKYGRCVVKIGAMEDDVIKDKTELGLGSYNSFEGRLRQHTGFTEIIHHMQEIGLKYQLDLYINLIDKTFYLISLNRNEVDTETYHKYLLKCKERCLQDARMLSENVELINFFAKYADTTISCLLK